MIFLRDFCKNHYRKVTLMFCNLFVSRFSVIYELKGLSTTMLKLFSLEEANRLIPTLEGFLNDLQVGVRDTLRLRQELSENDPYSLEAHNILQELHFLLHQINDSRLHLEKMGIFLKDVENGHIDFASQLGAEIVYLTYEKGKESITHYHRLNEGTPLPLPANKAQQGPLQI